MFDSFFSGNSEAKMQEKVRKETMNFERQQDAMKVNVPEERLDYIQQESRSDLIKWQQDLDDELIELVMKLKGYSKHENGWIKVRDEPLCNDLFIDSVVIPQCKPFLSRNLINSNFKEESVLCSLKNTADDIADNMADGYDIYGIKFTNYNLVTRSIKNVITPGAFRALNGWTKRTDSTNFKRVESSFDNPQQPTRELFKFR